VREWRCGEGWLWEWEWRSECVREWGRGDSSWGAYGGGACLTHSLAHSLNQAMLQ
jgi:hypothetical protein